MTHALAPHTTRRQKLQTWRRAALSIAAGVAGVLAFCASAQQGNPPALDAQTQSQAIIRHLNSVIQFHRTVHEPIQKAGEPNDVVYRDQAVAQASQIAGFAFQSAKAEAALLSGQNPQAAAPQSSDQQRMQASQARAEQRITDLRQRLAVLDRQIAAAPARKLEELQTQRNQLQAALDLSMAMKDALEKITSFSRGAAGKGLVADVERLQQSIPELQGNDNKTSYPQITTVESALSSGVVTQSSVLIDLAESRHTLQTLLDQNEKLHQQVLALRTPMVAILRGLIATGQQLSDDAAPPAQDNGAPAEAPPVAPADLKSITTRFKSVSAATVPLSQEMIVLDQSRANLSAWQSSLTNEYGRILNALMLRILVIALALAVIFGGGELWTRATTRYIRDMRRRRHFLIIRRIIVGFLSVLVVVFGFFTQFHSLATFAGLITAGVAVGLQTILLSVAAYFFIIGRYGIKVGDRITIASVTGEVIEVGLVRFYVMELAGSSNELNPTGRVAVFSNAVLFQPTTPLYKQVPGTAYSWHELIVKLSDAAYYKTVCGEILKIIESVYHEYRPAVLRQHQAVQNWMQTNIAAPEIESRLQFTKGTFQFWARFPVEIHEADATDEKITHALLDLMASNPAFKAGVAAPPTIQSAVRG